MQIIKRRRVIERYMSYWHRQLEILQNKCKHKKAVKEPRGNTGNYDPSNDHYWYDCRCPDCGKFWMEDQ